MNYSTFRYPIYDAEYSADDIPEVKSAHIKVLYHIEVGKSIKLAHKLNDKVLNPCVLEKTYFLFIFYLGSYYSQQLYRLQQTEYINY